MRELKRINEYIKNNGALIIVLKYGIFGVLWISLSDMFLGFFADNFEIYKLIQIYKGGAFVIITMITVYILVNNREIRIRSATENSLKTLKELKHIAYYDTLTGLPNRYMFASKIKNLSNNSNNKFAIAYVDIDNFKYINDTLGHHIGDEFLKFIGCKIAQDVKSPDMVARLGGDEFAILFANYESKEILLKKLKIVKKNLGNTWNSDGREFFISTSIGVAICPSDGHDFDTLLKHSDIAMYAGKKEGKNKIYFYNDDLNEETIWYIRMANNIQRGMENKEFELYYQPQIHLKTGKIMGVEALLRWNYSGEGFISPDEFIPVAEKTGQIYELERRIIENALIQKKNWEEKGLIDLELSLNLSSKSLISNSSFKKIEVILSKYNIDYSKLVIEITETAAITNVDIAIERIKLLKSMGLKIALDDFGTGYSSITYLKKLPIDIVKLDRSYTKDNGKDSSIAKFIVSLAHELNLSVIAEGIETKGQLEYLKNINCEFGQGFLIGKPMCIKDINKILENNVLVKCKM